MVTELVKGLSNAFNGGNIQPTVLVFPPRNVDSRGPMIWNHQVLQFAGYETEAGTVLGDPASVEITKAIIDLGWQPPEPYVVRSQISPSLYRVLSHNPPLTFFASNPQC